MSSKIERQAELYRKEMGEEAFARQMILRNKIIPRKCNCSLRHFGSAEIVSKFHRWTCPMYLREDGV